MIRTQIQLTEEQVRRLKAMAAEQGESMAALIRRSVDALLAVKTRGCTGEREQRALAASGRFRSGLTDVSENHDRYLADIYAEVAE
jgi:ribbon-helix-helix CopG family protein